MDRKRFIDVENQKILLAKIEGSEQEQDLTEKPTCGGYARIHHFKRQIKDWINDPLPIDPANKYFGLPYNEPQINVQVFQLPICNMNCWYCFVPDNLKNLSDQNSKWFSTSEIVDHLEMQCKDKTVIDLSGGNPELTPEWPLWLARELKKRNLDKKYYIWSDDTLSTESMFTYLSEDEIKELASYKNYGKVCCFKGFDEESYEYNCMLKKEFYYKSFKTLKKYIEYGFDVYGYITLTTNSIRNIKERIANFMDKVQKEISFYFPLRIIPLKIFQFTPTMGRMIKNPDSKKAIDNQNIAIKAWCDEIKKRFTTEEIQQNICEIKIKD